MLTPTALRMPNTWLSFVEIEIHRSLKPLCVLASSDRAIDQDLTEDNPNQADHQVNYCDVISTTSNRQFM